MFEHVLGFVENIAEGVANKLLDKFDLVAENHETFTKTTKFKMLKEEGKEKLKKAKEKDEERKNKKYEKTIKINNQEYGILGAEEHNGKIIVLTEKVCHNLDDEIESIRMMMPDYEERKLKMQLADDMFNGIMSTIETAMSQVNHPEKIANTFKVVKMMETKPVYKFFKGIEEAKQGFKGGIKEKISRKSKKK